MLERSAMAKDYIVQSQQTQIGTLNTMLLKKDAMLLHSDAAIESLKKQMKTERKKYALTGAGVGAAVVVMLVAMVK